MSFNGKRVLLLIGRMANGSWGFWRCWYAKKVPKFIKEEGLSIRCGDILRNRPECRLHKHWVREPKSPQSWWRGGWFGAFEQWSMAQTSWGITFLWWCLLANRSYSVPNEIFLRISICLRHKKWGEYEQLHLMSKQFHKSRFQLNNNGLGMYVKWQEQNDERIK